jgi:hypothetical protein
VKIRLRKGLARIRGLRRARTEEEQDTVAKEIVEHLELSIGRLKLVHHSGATDPVSRPRNDFGQTVHLEHLHRPGKG